MGHPGVLATEKAIATIMTTMTKEELSELSIKIREKRASEEERKVFIEELKKTLKNLQVDIAEAKGK